MNSIRTVGRICVTVALCVALAAPAVGAEQTEARQAAQTTSGEATTSSAVSHGEFSTRAEPLPRLPPVASEGGCEPRYRNGQVGTCINKHPCRGFGVREKDGSATCICYVKRGGCAGDERCDAQEGQCVKDDESEFNRER